MDNLEYSDWLKNAGNELYKAGHYIQALEKYQNAIIVLSNVFYLGNYSREMAVLWNNRANALFKLQRWSDALYSAKQSVQLNPSFVKAYYRAGVSALKLHDIPTALIIFEEGLHNLNRQVESKEVVEFLHGIFMSFEGAGSTPTFRRIFEGVWRERYTKAIWQPLIVKLMKEKMYKSCIYLMTHGNSLPSDINDLKVPLGGIFESFMLSAPCKDMKFINGLVIWLVTMGADVETIGELPLHTVIQLCMMSADNSLFQLIIKMKPDMKKNINKQDRDGNTVLHLVASFPANSHGYTLMRQAQDVKMLLDLGVDPCINNKQGKDAATILKRNKNFKVEDVIKKHLASQVSSAAPKASSTSTC